MVKSFDKVKYMLSSYYDAGITIRGNAKVIQNKVGAAEFKKYRQKIADYLQNGRKRLQNGKVQVTLLVDGKKKRKFQVLKLSTKLREFTKEADANIKIAKKENDLDTDDEQVQAAKQGLNQDLLKTILVTKTPNFQDINWKFVLDAAGLNGDPIMTLLKAQISKAFNDHKQEEELLFGTVSKFNVNQIMQHIAPFTIGITLPRDAPQVLMGIYLKDQMFGYGRMMQYMKKGEDINEFLKMFHIVLRTSKFNCIEEARKVYSNKITLEADFQQSLQAYNDQVDEQDRQEKMERAAVLKLMEAQAERTERKLQQQEARHKYEMELIKLQHIKEFEKFRSSYRETMESFSRRHHDRLGQIGRIIQGIMPININGNPNSNQWVYDSQDSSYCGDDVLEAINNQDSHCPQLPISLVDPDHYAPIEESYDDNDGELVEGQLMQGWGVATVVRERDPNIIEISNSDIGSMDLNAPMEDLQAIRVPIQSLWNQRNPDQSYNDISSGYEPDYTEYEPWNRQTQELQEAYAYISEDESAAQEEVSAQKTQQNQNQVIQRGPTMITRSRARPDRD